MCAMANVSEAMADIKEISNASADAPIISASFREEYSPF